MGRGGEETWREGRGDGGVGRDVQGQMGESRWDSPPPAPSPDGFPHPPLLCRFWFRLYWFPLKVLYATCHCSLRAVPDIPFYFFFNALLLLLTLMNLYWFLVSRSPRLPARPLSLSRGPVPVPVPTRRSGHRRPLGAPRAGGGVGAGGRSARPSGRRGQDGGFSSPVPPLPQYIVAFAAKVLTGQVRELKDVREYDAAEAQGPKPSKAE